MRLLKTPIERYIEAALESAVTSETPDGAIEAHLDGLLQLRAYGDDRHDCYRALSGLIFDWVRIWLERGYDLPVYGDVDLNPRRKELLVSFHSASPGNVQPPANQVFETDEEFLAALDRYADST